MNNSHYFVEPLSPERFKKDVPLTESEPICPYCKTVLDKGPKRKKKCPFCNNDIYIRSKPRIFPHTLLTKDDSIAVDWYNKLEWQGIEQKDFLIKKAELSEANKEVKSTDIVFHLLEDELAKSKDIYKQRVIYFEMASLQYETGGEFFEYLQNSNKTHLMEFKQDGFEKVRISSAGGCESCIDIMGKVLTIDEALREMPIPNKKCTFQLHGKIPGWCRCIYVAYFDDPELDTPDSFYEEKQKGLERPEPQIET